MSVSDCYSVHRLKVQSDKMTRQKIQYGNKFIGAHVSAAGGVDKAPIRAHEIGLMRLRCLQRISANGQRSHSKQKQYRRLKTIVKS